MCVGGEGVMSAPGTEHATAGTDAPPTALPSLSLQAWCILGVRSFFFFYELVEGQQPTVFHSPWR